MSTVEFPAPHAIHGRLFFVGSEVEAYKRGLAGLPPLPQDAIIEMVPAKKLAAELAITRRTLGRRIAERELEWAA